jgi:hypothetical protein
MLHLWISFFVNYCQRFADLRWTRLLPEMRRTELCNHKKSAELETRLLQMCCYKSFSFFYWSFSLPYQAVSFLTIVSSIDLPIGNVNKRWAFTFYTFYHILPPFFLKPFDNINLFQLLYLFFPCVWNSIAE